jgi:hypothetical protein
MCGSEAVPPFTYWLWTARLYWIVVFSYTILLIDSSGPDFLFCFLGIMLPRVHLHVPWERVGYLLGQLSENLFRVPPSIGRQSFLILALVMWAPLSLCLLDCMYRGAVKWGLMTAVYSQVILTFHS